MRNLKFRKRQSVCASAAVPPLRATAHASAGSSRSRRRRSERPPLHGRQWSGEPRAQSSSYSVTRLDQSKRERRKKRFRRQPADRCREEYTCSSRETGAAESCVGGRSQPWQPSARESAGAKPPPLKGPRPGTPTHAKVGKVESCTLVAWQRNSRETQPVAPRKRR